MSEDFRAAIGEASAKIRDLEVLLRAERCIVPVHVLPDEDEDCYVELSWKPYGKSRAWRIVGKWDGVERPLLELPSHPRLGALPYLDRLADAAREATRKAIKRAGLGGDDR